MQYSLALIVTLTTSALAADLSQSEPTLARSAQDAAQARLIQAQSLLAQADADASADAADTQSRADYSYYLATGSGQAAGPGHTLVIPKDAGEAKDLGGLEEDLAIMARILHKAANTGEGKSRSAMGIGLQYGWFGEAGAPPNLYLDGYGALFFLHVNHPLLAPAAKKAETEPKDTSREWEDARRELQAPPHSDFTFDWPQPFSPGDTTEEYDAAKVEGLKNALITALKNAAYIHRLRPEETVTVVVTGRGSSGGGKVMARRTSGSRAAVIGTGAGSSEGAGGRLILRARKSDTEAFQKDNLTLDEFRKKVTVILR